ncbi:uncharacterized protein LAESUDRAFT_694050 [Laetiporus sulphureus 93-53]|uniref:DUF1275 domain protein n=1 Tax=Laetiporus sulphureus 93-53 TaxID=1314785 RepID=A0A165GIZ8_9APHY|nr:uncharacterized protein LAESUDRAFT_694050 [Laetiporus sulphureus 93-53]KZT10414.1 hypothetical protein LAESUDRAFT_694050 [Laetiporus sulphureus 93-53]
MADITPGPSYPETKGEGIPSDPYFPDDKADQLPRPASADSRRTVVASARLWIAPSVVLTRDYLMTDVDPAKSSIPLAAFCFMTGFVDAVVFTAIFVWAAFQTGNTVQLSLAVARLFSKPRDVSFHISDQQALCSLLSFNVGSFIGRLGDRMGPKSRAWLMLGTFIQALFTMAAAVAVWQSGSISVATDRFNPAWTDALTFVAVGFMSASVGLQGIMGKRINTQFSTTVVFTTVWCELMADPKLFQLNHWVISRDHKIIGIIFLFVGGFVGRALIDAIGSASALGIGCGIRIIIAIWWLFIPAKVSAPKAKKPETA